MQHEPDPETRATDPVANGDPESAEGATQTIAMGFSPWKADQPSEARPPQPPASDNAPGSKKKWLPNSDPEPETGLRTTDPVANGDSLPLGSPPRE